LSQGVTTVEIKSGYGLSYDDELKLLRAISAAAADFPGTVMATFLGAHAIPPEFAANRDDYIHLLCTQLIPEIAATRLATAVDVFCETIAFSLDETSRILEAAQRHGLGIKLHAEQLSASGAAKRGAMMGALSCDHLEYIDGQGAEAMAASGTVAVLLPGSYYMLRETQKPPTDLLRQHKVPMAVATDFNPGTSPVASLLTAANFSCILFGLTVSEAFYGITAAAAQAIGHKKPYGALLPGDSADLAIWESTSVAELISGLGQNLCVGVYARGHWCPTASLQGQTS
jgi:imidazolonepropionase